MMPYFAQVHAQMLSAFERLPAREFPEMLAAVTNKDQLDAEFRSLVQRFYDRAYRGGNVVDKTPSLDAVRAVPFIHQTFPNARFVFCYRRALENVESRLRKWPAVAFETHCSEWGEIMSTWRRVRAELEPHQFWEVEIHRLFLDPTGEAIRLRNLVGGVEDDVAVIRDTLTEEKPSMIAGSEVGRVLDLDSMSWSSHQRTTFLKFCQTELDWWGYTLDHRYFADQASPGPSIPAD